MDYLSHFRVITDFKPGVNFYDISTMLLKPEVVKAAIDQMCARLAPYDPDLILGIESRGFVVGAPLALAMGLPFAMARKPGKLPGDTISESYGLEYGTDSLYVQPDLISGYKRVAILDDLLATGGTMQAAEKLVERAGSAASVNAVIVELDGLAGRDKLQAPLEALVKAPC